MYCTSGMALCFALFTKCKGVFLQRNLVTCCYISLFNFRLGNISCLADPEDLLVYKDTEAFRVIRDTVMDCSREGLSLPSSLVGAETCGFFTVCLHIKGALTLYLHCLCACSEPFVKISSLLLNNTELKIPSSLSPGRLAEFAPLLPALGVPFLQDLTPSQMLDALPALSSVSFSPAQVEERTPPVVFSGRRSRSHLQLLFNMHSFFFTKEWAK